MPFLDGDKEERRTVLEKPIFENSVLSKSVPELKKKEDDQKKRTFILPKIGNKNFIPNSEFQHLEDKKMKRLAEIRDFHSRKKDPQRKSQLLGSHTERSEVNLDHSLESIDSDNFGIRSLIANDQKKKKHFLSVDSLAKRVRENNKKYISRNKDILGLPKISKNFLTQKTEQASKKKKVKKKTKKVVQPQNDGFSFVNQHFDPNVIRSIKKLHKGYKKFIKIEEEIKDYFYYKEPVQKTKSPDPQRTNFFSKERYF